MTAVAPSSNQQQPATAAPARKSNDRPNGDASQNSLNSPIPDDLPRMFVPRRSAQRSNSSSSISSTTSSGSTVSASSNTPASAINGDARITAPRNRPTRTFFPPTSRVEPITALSGTRTPVAPLPSPGPPAAGVTNNALQSPGLEAPVNIATKVQGQSEGAAILQLLPMNGTFDAKSINVPYHPDLVRIGRQTNQKTVPTAHNGYFDSKVLSRQHAEIYAERDGTIWIRDVKSSNGTFVNGKRLSPENKESEPHILNAQDILELGIDIVSEDQKTVVHHKVAARVEHAGFSGSSSPSSLAELTFGDMDPSLLQLGQQSMQGNRSRAGSQGANGANGRFPSLITNGNMMQAAYHPKWLQPITIETIVKRLNTELKAAQLQANELKHTASFVDAVVGKEKSPRPTLSSSSPTKSFDGYKHPHSSPPPPPGPPPTQPLPEAPSSASTNGKLRAKLSEIQPLLRRDTEKPKHSPIKSAGEKLQIRNLVEALTTAQKEIGAQAEKLKTIQDTLEKERLERKDAQERSSRSKPDEESSSQTATIKDIPKINGILSHDPSTISETDVPTLHSIITTMRGEMTSLRAQLATAQRRAEVAEDESRRDRKTLIEMVESIKQREERAKKRRDSRRGSSNSKQINHLNEKTKHSHSRTPSSDTSSEEDEFLDFEDDSAMNGKLDQAVRRLREHGHVFTDDRDQQLSNGPVSPLPTISHLQHLGKSALETLLPSSNDHSSTTDNDVDINDKDALVKKESIQQQASPSAQAATNTSSSPTATRTRGKILTQDLTVAEAAPYASMVGIVLLGVGMMAWLNGWQGPRVER